MALISILGDGALPRPLRALVERVAGFTQVVVSGDAIVAGLEQAELLVPYHQRSERLGLDTFPLALDGPAHTHARDLIARAIDESAVAHHGGVDQARASASTRVDHAGRHLDVIGGLVDPVLAEWAEHWFGLPGQGQHLLRSGRMIAHAMFLNPAMPKGATDAPALDRAASWVHDHHVELTGLVAEARAGSLAHRVLHHTGGDTDLTARHVLGLSVGPLALGSQSLSKAIAHVLRAPEQLDRLAASHDPLLAARPLFLEALRAGPPLPGVIRTSDRPVAVRRPRRRTPLDLPAGPVLLATQLAMRCPDAGAEPDEHLAFGHGVHRCLGPVQITDVASVVLAALATRAPRRTRGRRGRITSGPAPSGVRSWGFPGHLEVTFGS